MTNEFWLIIGGIASILFSGLMVWFPLAGALALVWLISAYAIVFRDFDDRVLVALARTLGRSNGPVDGLTSVAFDDAGTIVVGGGHAGVEAALAAARLGVPTIS